MLNDKQIKAIELQLNNSADAYYHTTDMKVWERNRGYCQGVAFMLEKIGYRIEWDAGKATVVKDD